LKTHLETEPEGTMSTHVFEVNIRATPLQVWAAMTEPDVVRRWNFGLSIDTAWEVGGPLRYLLPDGAVATDAIIEAIEPGRGWVLRVHHPYAPALAGEPPYRQTMEITSVSASVTKVTITLDDFAAGSATEQLLQGGTRGLLDSFKSLLETGEALVLS
jgi:uncharacterized protein YndB with AHSA1/START domain